MPHGHGEFQYGVKGHKKDQLYFNQLLTSLKAKKEKGTLDSMKGDSELDMGHIITLMEDHLLEPSLMTRERALVSCITPRGSGERESGSRTSFLGR